eukprot:TRINITY_DN932_c0_g1_i5.p3 TRINITY_DN932_c0_g1~~TRINITY_DN932_c0_g1_i5.p3  ORF type:complete len:110 (+),score=25.36 TRINITY_DN932_c0_g1_i5:2-331(+)
MIRRPPRSTQSRSSAASDVYKRQAFVSVSPFVQLSELVGRTQQLHLFCMDKFVGLLVFCKILACLNQMLINSLRQIQLNTWYLSTQSSLRIFLHDIFDLCFQNIDLNLQ